MDGDPAIRIDLHRAERTVRPGAVILGGAGDAGADENSGLLPARLLMARCCQIACCSSLSRISGVRTETLYGFPVMVRPPALSALRRRNSIGSSGSAAAASSISTSSAVIVCSVP